MTSFLTSIPPEAYWAVFGAVIGVVIDRLFRKFEEKRKFKKELEDNNFIDVSGKDWFAAWQTSIEGRENINTEPMEMTQKGNTVKMKNTARAKENPKGAYLWEGQMSFFQGRNLMGWYFPKQEENNVSKGIMYFAYHSQSKVFYGRWVGCAYDGELVSGFVVISKNRAHSIELLTTLISAHPSKVNISYLTFN